MKSRSEDEESSPNFMKKTSFMALSGLFAKDILGVRLHLDALQDHRRKKEERPIYRVRKSSIKIEKLWRTIQWSYRMGLCNSASGSLIQILNLFGGNKNSCVQCRFWEADSGPSGNVSDDCQCLHQALQSLSHVL